MSGFGLWEVVTGELAFFMLRVESETRAVRSGPEVLACDSMRLLYVKASFTRSSLSEASSRVH
jgi:hypothetical protein